MSSVVVVPGALGAATSDLIGISAALRQAHTAAASSTTGLVAAAEDEISAAVASLFSSYGQQFQALGAQMAVSHQQFAEAPEWCGERILCGRGGERIAVADGGATGVIAVENFDWAPAVRERCQWGGGNGAGRWGRRLAVRQRR